MPEFLAVDDADCVDDSTILNADIILRRIHPTQLAEETAPDNTRRLRPSSNAFKDSANPPSPVSAAQQKMIPDIMVYMSGEKGLFLASFEAGWPRNNGLIVSSIPPVESEPEHVYIAGKKQSSIIKRWAKECRWVISPPADAIPPVR